jgi:hypothetical protein
VPPRGVERLFLFSLSGAMVLLSPPGSGPWAVSPGQLFLGWDSPLSVILRSSSSQNSDDFYLKSTTLALLSLTYSFWSSLPTSWLNGEGQRGPNAQAYFFPHSGSLW